MSKIKTKIIKKRKLNTADNLEKQIPRSFRCTNNRCVSVPLLYRLVYSSKISFITVFILLLSFVFQGASLTYAQEDSQPEPTAEETIATMEEVDQTEEFEGESSLVKEDTVIEPSLLSSEDENYLSATYTEEEIIVAGDLPIENTLTSLIDSTTSDTSPPLDDPPIIDTVTIQVEPDSLSDNDVLSVIENDVISTSTSQNFEAGAENEPEVIPEPHSPDSNNLAEENISDTVSDTVEFESSISSSTSATSSIEVIEEAVTITKSDTEFTFNRNECTALASGSFYCLKADVELPEDALFSAPDIDGDLEIYLVREGIQTQVTKNLVDDAAPFFDQNSNTIVWHRLIDDRYQIISYDIASGAETQLTNGSTNSMEPTRQGKYTVWQNWSNNNWNVVLLDGKEQRTITESSSHDIAPYVHGSLVVWNRYNSGEDKTIEMYDMISETYVTVDDPEGLSVTNPRMVFVYDSLHPNGDIVTKGYDMISRKFIQLDTLPRQLPDEIPESESTGETRALIQSKPSVKSDESVQNNNNATTTGPNPSNLPPAISTDLMTLDLTAVSSSSVEVAPVLDIPLMTEYELIIPPLDLPPETVQE